MKACIQRVSEARVVVEGQTVGEIGAGLVVLLGVARDDTPREAEWLAEKTVELRIFEDEAGKMNRSLRDIGGSVLAISQFTLLGDTRKGRRPSFVQAAPPELAEPLYEAYIAAVRARGVTVATGIFRAHMAVTLTNDGPVTLLLEVSPT